MKCVLPNGKHYTKEQYETVYRSVKQAWETIKEVVTKAYEYIEEIMQRVERIKETDRTYYEKEIKPLYDQVMGMIQNIVRIRNNC